MIRGTRNQGIACGTKKRVTYPGVLFGDAQPFREGLEWVLIDEVTQVADDAADWQIRLEYQSTTPSNAFNGTFDEVLLP